MRTSPFLENFIHANYPGVNLPPLWQVIYQEAMRGHHLLFRRADVERFDQDPLDLENLTDHAHFDQIESIAMRLIACSDLQSMIRVVDSQPEHLRRSLYHFYHRVLWMWRNYVRDQLN